MSELNSDPHAAAAAVDAITLATCEENAAGARRLAAIGDLWELRAPDDDIEKRYWAIDGYSGLVVEVAAALGVSRKRAQAQVDRAVMLRTRLPKVAAVYAKGLIDAVLVAMIVARTDLIIDDDVAGQVDADLAAKIVAWGRLSKPKVEQRIDAIIAASDQAGVHPPKPPSQARYLDIRACGPGTASVCGTLDAAAAAVLDAALDGLATGVCRNDGRSHDQRRAAAIDALARGGRLRCECGQADCPATVGELSAPTVGTRAVIHVIAAPEAVHGQAPGFLPGYGQIPAEQVARLAEGATIRQVDLPPDTAEPRYRPSVKLAEFVRCRDLTCRFPDCDRPADACDIDHTRAYPAGQTHPSNLKCLCRFHHLLKTFHNWQDQQFPDGTVVWTAPTGHTYITKPEGAHWYPQLATPTGTPEATQEPERTPARGHCMPKRKRTRAQERQQWANQARMLNEERIASEEWHRCRELEMALAAEQWDEPAPF
ncbi:HNH endonuclease signature motif containing protein [Mycolicibacterium sp. lyk4-40-TYG-92]|uniref:HNH endonuclease signature motif containing protein n=1 Tax=Mycolicibacterium sp. lyk4-40-TYG-92 TaxID=3040295 RepID=UPI00255156BF|nr:HNH endonuclease signature motif containing protein [Mycolicibacterium sp. lyk4-40-TYG-92]